MMMKHVLFALILIAVYNPVNAQSPTQDIKGMIYDEETREPLPFVNIVIKDSDPVIGTSTDIDGNFILKNIPLGRISLVVSYVGYESKIIPELILSSARSINLEIALSQSYETLGEIVIKPKVEKQKPLNQLANVSARMMSVEEANRYAGGFDDPARLASAFPGVASSMGNNAIVIRGNAPKYLQWKIEGVEIPNPNHFADLGAFGGGGLTALSSNLLANSDFFTGAFPAEYNNAISGVFDIRMRNGNSSSHNHHFEAGLIGIDFASEGPISKNNNSSYLVNYRYSTLGLMAPLLPEDAEGTNYQDLSFKLKFPTKHAGTFSWWGIGLLDNSGTKPETDPENRSYYQDVENQDINQYMGATGINHRYLVNNSGYINSTLAFSTNGVDLITDRLAENEINLIPENYTYNKNYNLTFKSFYNKKVSSKFSTRNGITARGMWFNMRSGEANQDKEMQEYVNEKGGSSLLSLWSNSTFNWSRWKVNFGFNYQYFTLNEDSSLEPRLGMTYRLNDRSSLSLGYGRHSRVEPLNIYFARVSEDYPGLNNKDLQLTKANHFVLSYDLDLSELIHLKIEPYYQVLTDVPMQVGGNESLLNLQNDWFISDAYENSGEGRNYGIDVSVEKFLSKGYYFLVSGSVFRSQFRNEGGPWFDTRYNKGYLFNALFGKEFWVGDHRQNSIGVNFRVSYQGGDRHSPIDQAASALQKDVVYDESLPFTIQVNSPLIFHTTISYQWNKENTTQQLSLKILNATAYKEFQGHRYNFRTGQVEEFNEALIVPNLSYKVSF